MLFSVMANCDVDDVAVVIGDVYSLFYWVDCEDYVAVVIGVGSNVGWYCWVYVLVGHDLCPLRGNFMSPMG